LGSTGNLIRHYDRNHKSIPTSLADLKRQQRASLISTDSSPASFFMPKRTKQLGFNEEKYKELLLDFLASNNLALRLVERPSFQALVEFLNSLVIINHYICY